MHKSILHFGIIILLLTACTPATESPTTIPSTIDPLPVTNAPALKPVTPSPTQKRVFTTEPTATKDLIINSETESHEPKDNAGSRTNVDMGEAIFIYERADGRKGIGPSVITWTIYPDGRVISSDGRSWQVPPDDITTLLDSIMTLGFADFEASYIPKDTCCDRATHTITIRQGSEVYQVSVLDSVEGVPSELYQALGIINDFLLALPT